MGSEDVTKKIRISRDDRWAARLQRESDALTARINQLTALRDRKDRLRAEILAPMNRDGQAHVEAAE